MRKSNRAPEDSVSASGGNWGSFASGFEKPFEEKEQRMTVISVHVSG